MKKLALFTAFLCFAVNSFGQESDSILISRIFREALTNTWSYNVLKELCEKAPHRLAGSEGSLKAVNLMYDKLKPLADTVYLQEVTAKRWLRGKQEELVVSSGKQTRKIQALALGGSVGTGNAGLKAKVIEVQGLEALPGLGREKIEGNIVFFNLPMDPVDMNPGRQYGKAGGQRFSGAEKAAFYGARAVIVRSLSNSLSLFPHTGIMRYVDSVPKIPAVAISTIEAENLSKQIKSNPETEVFLRTWCSFPPNTKSYNVIAEVRGTELPEEIITIGGHLDSWDVGQGAHDDGAGCLHSMEALRIIKTLGIKTKRTIRAVLFMDEEMYQVGGRKYAQRVKERNEKIYAAIESDSGGAMPVGFGCSANDHQFSEFLKIQPLLEPYGVKQFRKGGGGVDIRFLSEMNVPLMNIIPEPQRYFEFHHSANDTFDKISFRELQLGCAAMASMVVMLDLKDSFK